jgi:hypothetical protein
MNSVTMMAHGNSGIGRAGSATAVQDTDVT